MLSPAEERAKSRRGAIQAYTLVALAVGPAVALMLAAYAVDLRPGWINTLGVMALVVWSFAVFFVSGPITDRVEFHLNRLFPLDR